MNWKVIIYSSLFGIVMAFITISFIPENVEPILWLFVFGGVCYFTAKHVTSKFFLHGFIIGLLCTVYKTAIHIGFLDFYSSNHPSFFERMPKGMSMTRYYGAASVAVGTVCSLVLGGLCYAAAKYAKKV